MCCAEITFHSIQPSDYNTEKTPFEETAFTQKQQTAFNTRGLRVINININITVLFKNDT